MGWPNLIKKIFQIFEIFLRILKYELKEKDTQKDPIIYNCRIKTKLLMNSKGVFYLQLDHNDAVVHY